MIPHDNKKEESVTRTEQQAISSEGMHRIVYESKFFTVSAYGKPHISREEGGHLIIEAKRAVTDRTKLTPEEAKDYMRLSMMAGEALELAMNRRGIPVVKVNYLDNGNWAFKQNSAPQMHMHILGRAVDARVQEFPEAVKLPARESGFYRDFKPLNDKDIAEIIFQFRQLENSYRYSPENW